MKKSFQSVEIFTSVGTILLSEEEHAQLAQILTRNIDVGTSLSFYNSTVKRNGAFPLEWELPIVRAVAASAPDREDLRERLSIVEKAHAEVGKNSAEGKGDVNLTRLGDVTIQTSVGPIALTRAEHLQLLKVLASETSADDGQALYASLSERNSLFPPEWEIRIVRATARVYPHRDDILARLAELEELIPSESTWSDLTYRLAFHKTWSRFSRADLSAEGSEADRRMWRRRAVDDACAILSSSVFAEQQLSRRVEILVGLHNTLMSVPSPDLPSVAEVGIRRFREMLGDPQLVERQACAVFDCLHALYFSGISDTQELRRFDSLVPDFEAWLEARHGRHVRPPATYLGDGPTTIAYLFHTAHFERGNAVNPVILSLVEKHAERSDRRIILYLVQHVASDFVDRVTERGVAVRTFEQATRYDRIDEIADALRADSVDVVVTEQNRSIAASLFVRRVATRQLWIDMGFPFWSLRALDWTLSPVARHDALEPGRTSPIVLRQNAETLEAAVDEHAVRAVRDEFGGDVFLLGVFVRLAKLDSAYFDFLERLLVADSRFRLLIAGPGDQSLVDDFLSRPTITGRVKFVPGLVDLNVYGSAVDVMCDTFPFIGGLACRDVTAQGTPVLAKLGTNWDVVLRADRNPDLLASSEQEYIELALQLANDSAFRAKQRGVALEKAREFSRSELMVDDVEAAIVACR